MAKTAHLNPTTTAIDRIERTLILDSLLSARQFGGCLAAVLQKGDIIRLEGDLGAGKTELARAVIQARASAAIDVPSPTFTLVQIYELPGINLLHADLYRLGDPSEVAELGLFDDTDCAVLIEWWSRAEAALPEPGLVISLEQGDGEDERIVQLSAHPALWAHRIDKLMS